jgi:hypothetical protein
MNGLKILSRRQRDNWFRPTCHQAPALLPPPQTPRCRNKDTKRPCLKKRLGSVNQSFVEAQVNAGSRRETFRTVIVVIRQGRLRGLRVVVRDTPCDTILLLHPPAHPAVVTREI